MKKEITEAMLMTAGLGTRMRPFSDRIPKPLLPILGIPVIQFTIDSLTASGVQTLVANIHHRSEMMNSLLPGLDYGQSVLQVSDESQELLGSAGGIRKALDRFTSDSFYYVNGDVLCDLDWQALARCHARLRSIYQVEVTLAVFPEGPFGASYREILFDPKTLLVTGLGEVGPRRPFFVGSAVLEKAAFREIPSHVPLDFVSAILKPAIRQKKVGVFLCRGSWHDIGSPQLWYQTHLSLIDTLEIGSASPVSRAWLNRIQKVNLRLGERIWTSRGSPRLKPTTLWAGPGYWDGRGVTLRNRPAQFGPAAIFYGSLQPRSYQQGIGMEDLWFQNTPNSGER